MQFRWPELVSKTMLLQLDIRLSGTVALLSLWLAACSSTVEPARRGTECAAACEAKHPDGLHLYNVVISECVCTGCSEDCSQSVCVDKRTPSDACLPCVQASLDGPACREHGGLFGSCLDTKDCADFVTCITTCAL